MFIYYCTYSPRQGSVSDVSGYEHRLGRALLCAGLREATGLPLQAGELDSLLACSASGKPWLPSHPSVHFNITHCPGMAACALGNFPLGLDAEPIGGYAPVLEKKILTEQEQSLLHEEHFPSGQEEGFHRLWTLKEAYVKMTGTGLDTDLKSFSFSFGTGTSKSRPVCSDPAVSCFQWIIEEHLVLSLCALSNGRPCSEPALIRMQAEQLP